MVSVDGATARPTARAVLEAGLDRDDPVRPGRDRRRRTRPGTRRLDGDHHRPPGAEARLACRNRLERHLDDLVPRRRPARRGPRAPGRRPGQRIPVPAAARRRTGRPRPARASSTDAITGGKSLDDAEHPALVLSHRISNHHSLDHPVPGHRDAPATSPPPNTNGWPACTPARPTTGPATSAPEPPRRPPRGRCSPSGRCPTAADAADRPDWEHRAGQVAAYREAVGWTDPEHALGQMPGATTTERRTTYTAAWHALGRPEERLTEAGMTEGQLRTRVRAWQNEQAWAPPNVDRALQGRRARRRAGPPGRRPGRGRAARPTTPPGTAPRPTHSTAKAQRLTDAAQARADWVGTGRRHAGQRRGRRGRTRATAASPWTTNPTARPPPSGSLPRPRLVPRTTPTGPSPKPNSTTLRSPPAQSTAARWTAAERPITASISARPTRRTNRNRGIIRATTLTARWMHRSTPASSKPSPRPPRPPLRSPRTGSARRPPTRTPPRRTSPPNHSTPVGAAARRPNSTTLTPATTPPDSIRHRPPTPPAPITVATGGPNCEPLRSGRRVLDRQALRR